MAGPLRPLPQITLDIPDPNLTWDILAESDDVQPPTQPFAFHPKISRAGDGSNCKNGHVKDCGCTSTFPLSRPGQDLANRNNCRFTRQPSVKRFWNHFHHDIGSKKPLKRSLADKSSYMSASSSSSIQGFPAAAASYKPPRLGTFTDIPLKAPLLNLPLPIICQILKHILSFPFIISMAPGFGNIPHREGISHLTLQESLRHPLFRVSRDIRHVSEEVFFSKNVFVVDLAGIYDGACSSGTSIYLKQAHRFWVHSTPQMVKNSIQRVSRLIVRLPVPSTDAATHRGREENEWMDGSDGKGGGGYIIKSTKKEVNNSLVIRKCLHAIVKLLLSPEQKRERSNMGATRLRKPRSVSSAMSVKIRRYESARVSELERELSLETEDQEVEARKPLRLLEIVLVKRNSRAMVLNEVLSLVHALKEVPVTGLRKICFELDGRKSVWATKRREHWEGLILNAEPDGTKLIQDLQLLQTYTPPSFGPIMSPAAFEYVTENRNGMLYLPPTAPRHRAMGMEDLIMPSTPRPKTAQQSAQKPRIDSFTFVMAQGISLL
ncbi:hypothetical protein K432DRAFT_393699 [Lepidopterella palustris CBS 459.81]|uniref:Uncharacterized protein n=1 Tax=Lepidopterella palustris CBS 459.81 TaxID=1314670 RepID=A0A8E2JEH4_9PEZI|nr:hypothetical protein K432DRAFT_393699 [Lepidopterella palustris CBS 459.81]